MSDLHKMTTEQLAETLKHMMLSVKNGMIPEFKVAPDDSLGQKVVDAYTAYNELRDKEAKTQFVEAIRHLNNLQRTYLLNRRCAPAMHDFLRDNVTIRDDRRRCTIKGWIIWLSQHREMAVNDPLRTEIAAAGSIFTQGVDAETVNKSPNEIDIEKVAKLYAEAYSRLVNVEKMLVERAMARAQKEREAREAEQAERRAKEQAERQKREEERKAKEEAERLAAQAKRVAAEMARAAQKAARVEKFNPKSLF